ncbi:MAG: diguanylate cyclase [Pseudomonadota bacterium]|nr:diguanylate cyclase [Pseudomonadota bacterium]
MSLLAFFRRRWSAGVLEPPTGAAFSTELDALLGQAPSMALSLGADGLVVWANSSQCQQLGLPLEALVGQSLSQVFCPEAAKILETALDHCRASGSGWQGVVICSKGPQLRHLSSTLHPVRREPACWLLMSQDITLLQRQAASAERLSESIESSVARLPGVVFRLHQSPAGQLSFGYLGPGFEAQTGLSRAQALEDAEVVLSRLAEETREQLTLVLAQSLVSLTPWHLDVRLARQGDDSGESERWFEARGTPQRFEDGAVVWDGLLLDVTKRKQAERRIAKLVSTDVLTGVMNRRAFFEAGAGALARLRRRQEPAVLAMLDLDHFKALNDAFGHSAGDMVLKAFADTCRLSLRPYDVLARIGGEEFVVLLADVVAEDAWDILERLRRNVETTTLKVDHRALKVTVSMGAISVGKEESLDMAMRRVDAALYEAKRAGRNRLSGLLQRFDEVNGGSQQAREYSSIHKELKMALSEDLRIPKACPNCGSHNMRVPATKNPDEKVHCASCQSYVCLYSEAAEMIEKTPKSEEEALIEKAMNRDK